MERERRDGKPKGKEGRATHRQKILLGAFADSVFRINRSMQQVMWGGRPSNPPQWL